MRGIKGDVFFHQQSENTPTNITVNITGIKEPLSWSIHRLPMIYDGGVKSCHSNLVGGVYDPDTRMSSSGHNSNCDFSKAGKFQNCAVGELEKKHGNLTANMATHYIDEALRLSGRSSINGRTLVLSHSVNGTPVACALITPPRPMFTAKAVFRSPVAGTMYLRQLNEQSDTFVFVNVFRVSPIKNGTLNWRIDAAMMDEDFDSSPDQCKSSSGIYNPYSMSDAENCSHTNHKGCYVGDLSKKHGNISASVATAMQAETSAKRVFTDANLPLKGVKSVLGRTLVLYNEEEVVACAKITEVQAKEVRATFHAATHKGIEGSFRFSQVSPFDPTTVEIRLDNLKKTVQGYHIHDYPNPAYKRMTGDMACSGQVAGGHFSPYAVMSSRSPASGTGKNTAKQQAELK